MSDQEYVPVRVSTLRGDLPVPFKVYLRVGGRYVLYVRNGDTFEGKRLAKIKEKKLKKMFIIPTDEPKYRDYITKNIEMAYDASSGMSVESRSSIVQGHQQSQTEELMDNVEDEKVYNESKMGAAKYVDFLLGETSGIKTILDMENTDNSVAHHGVNVATYAVALAEKLGIDEEQIKILALGCLIHDVAQAQPDCPRPNKPVATLSEDELAIYKEHPLKGANYVKDLQHFDTAVINIILQHEETIDGAGFPKGLSEKDIDPLAVIAGVANKMDKVMTEEKLTRIEASKKLLIECVGKFPLPHLQTMQKLAKELD